MAERKRNRKKKEHAENAIIDGKPTKDEYAVAKFLRQKLPEKKTMLLGHKVDYFIAARAIDCLLDSPWATKSGKQEPLFTTRDSIVEFMDRMLQHKFFHRARKIIVQKEPKKKKKDEDTAGDSSKEGKDKKSSIKEKESKDKKESIKEKEAKEVKELPKISSTKDKELTKESGDKKDLKAKEEDEKADEKKEIEKDEKKKEKKKIKLDMHLQQIFVDGNEAYVWIYDPIPVRAWIVGMLMVVGAVLVCLFPLWPQSIRHYIYYLSVAAAFFLVFIIGLAIIRLIVFVIIWTLTIGKHHLWLLPNLTEDVGFFESFWPLYKYEYKGTSKQKKDSDSKEEVEDDKEDETKSSIETKDKDSGEKSEKSDSNSDKEEDQMHSESEQESEVEKDDKTENSDKTDNGFELIDPEEEETQQHHNKSD